jgi:PBSX family phage terminase large subunit
MTAIKVKLSEKQYVAFKALTDPEYNEVVFGGGARGGKSYLGSLWIIMMCQAMPGSAWLIAREELKSLKRTTLRTFFGVMSSMGYRRDIDYHYNATDMVLTWVNGSVVFFGELKQKPGDPKYDRLGSYDLTGAWIDEAQEVCKNAKDTLQFRFSVLQGEGWETQPTVLYTCNPGDNWIYFDFWKPLIRDNKTVEGKLFITSLYSDNPYIDHKKYRTSVLRTKNKAKIQRLLYGNFEYSDDPGILFGIDKVYEAFENKLPKGEPCMSVDVARKGKDQTIIGIWDGLSLRTAYYINQNTIPQLWGVVKDLMDKYKIPKNRVIADESGVGGGLVDMLKCIGFIGNAKPKKVSRNLNYGNLRSQCYLELANYIDEGKIAFCVPNCRDKLFEELKVVKQKDIHTDKKIKVTSKEDVVEALGRSPDLADMVMMRMWFELGKGDDEKEDLEEAYAIQDEHMDGFDLIITQEKEVMEGSDDKRLREYEDAIDDILQTF